MELIQFDVVGNIYDFYISPITGRSINPEGEEICATGGQDCLAEWVQNNLMRYEEAVYLIDDVQSVFYVYELGAVTNEAGEVLCKTGGVDCLNDYISNTLLTAGVAYTVDFEIGGKVVTFTIEETGKVVDANNKMICPSGGQACLLKYVKSVGGTKKAVVLAQNYTATSSKTQYLTFSILILIAIIGLAKVMSDKKDKKVRTEDPKQEKLLESYKNEVAY